MSLWLAEKADQICVASPFLRVERALNGLLTSIVALSVIVPAIGRADKSQILYLIAIVRVIRVTHVLANIS